MFLAARFSSLGPSSLPEEIPLSGNTPASPPPGCEAFSGQSASLCPPYGPLVRISFCYIFNVLFLENRFCTLLCIYLSKLGV